MECLVSVVIPVYNVEKYLDECISSVINQTYRNLEIIIVDDGSTDNSPDIYLKYAQDDQRIKIIKKKHLGLGASRNIGIANAKGKYIYFLDSDDYIKENMFSSIIPYMEENKLDICFFSADVRIDDDSLEWNKEMYIKKKTYYIEKGTELLKDMYVNGEYQCQNCMFVTKRMMFDNLKYREGILHEDVFLAFQLINKAKLAGVLNTSFYFRRVRSNSIMTNSNIKKNYESYKVVLCDLYNYNERNINEFVKKDIIKSISKILIRQAVILKSGWELKMFFLKKLYFNNYKIFIYSFLIPIKDKFFPHE